MKTQCTHIEDGKGNTKTRSSGPFFQVQTGYDDTGPTYSDDFMPQHSAAEMVKRLYGKAKPRFARI